MINDCHARGTNGERLDADVSIIAATLDTGTRVDVTCRFPDAVVNRVVASLDVTVEEMLEHGFQSWSTVRRCRPTDVRPMRAAAPRWFRGQMLAERDGAGHELAGDTFLVYQGGVMGFLSAHLGFGRFRVDDRGRVEVHWLFDNVLMTSGDVVHLDALWIAEGPPGPLYSRYAALSGREMSARPSRTPARAWCSWYQYFADVTPNDVRENLALAVNHDIEVVQIDDGWQREIGVWGEVNDQWGESMDVIASEITRAGAVAGIWTAPFVAIEDGRIHREHPEWLVRNDAGTPTTALYHDGWGGRVYALDTTRDDVIEHLVATYRFLRSQGFDYFKIDFCHAAAAVGSRHDVAATRAQALRRGLLAVREGIGDDAYLLGCGCPLLSAVGVVDAMRISEDVAPFYEPRLSFDGFAEATVAARNAIEASVLRAPLHDRWFSADPDCVLLRRTNTELTALERSLVVEAAEAVSGFVVLSDRLADYDEADWALVSELFSRADPSARDLIDPFAADVELTWASGRSRINWDERRFERLS